MKYLSVLILLALGISMQSCEKDDIKVSKKFATKLKLEVTEINSENRDSYMVESNDFVKSRKWRDNSSKGITIERRIIFNAQTPSLDALEIEFRLWKYENIELLNLIDDEDEFVNGNVWVKNWDYKENKLELTEFYPETCVHVSVNGLIPSGEIYKLEITEAKEIEIDGEKVTWVEIEIDAELYGAYSPGQGAGYKIEGSFKGVLEQ